LTTKGDKKKKPRGEGEEGYKPQENGRRKIFFEAEYYLQFDAGYNWIS